MERRNFLKGLAGISAGIVATVLGGKKAAGENVPGEILELKAEPQGGYLVPSEHVPPSLPHITDAIKLDECIGQFTHSLIDGEIHIKHEFPADNEGIPYSDCVPQILDDPAIDRYKSNW